MRLRRSAALIALLLATGVAVGPSGGTRAGVTCSNTKHTHTTSVHFVKSYNPPGPAGYWKWNWRWRNALNFEGNEGYSTCGTWPSQTW